MKLVVGLGNPGREYEGTPHNVGFAVADEVARRRAARWRRQMTVRAEAAEAELDAGRIWLLKPLTYMNNSGSAVGAFARRRGVGAQDMLVVVDDASLSVGRMRIRERGSSGGHRGLESLIACLGSDAFARIRIGVGRGDGGADLVEHVLTRFRGGEREVIARVVAAAADAVLMCVERSVEAAMNAYNGWQAPRAPEEEDR